MKGYLLFGGLAGVAAVGAYVYVQTLRGDIEDLREELSRANMKLATCSARVINLLEDKESDAEIDRIPDSGLRDAVPDRWLRPEDRRTP